MTITVNKGVNAYMEYHRLNSRPNTLKGFGYTLTRFADLFGDQDVDSIPENDVATFLELITDGLKQSTKNGRAGHLRAFFNFVAEAFDLDFRNPCSRGLVKKLFKKPRHQPKELIDKELIDEIMYSARGGDRLMLELMGRGGMRIGEVLQIRPRNLHLEANTVGIDQPKSGRQGEVVYISSKMMRRLDDYVRQEHILPDKRIFPISYTTARRRVCGFGKAVGVKLSPHDLRRHAATQASRAGTPLEFVSKVILRHADLATTQIYLGAVSHAEASRVMENLYG